MISARSGGRTGFVRKDTTETQEVRAARFDDVTGNSNAGHQFDQRDDTV